MSSYGWMSGMGENGDGKRWVKGRIWGGTVKVKAHLRDCIEI